MIGLTAGQTVGWKLRAVEEAVLRQIAADELAAAAAADRRRRFLALAARVPFPRRGGA
jgi:hypothetical protein